MAEMATTKLRGSANTTTLRSRLCLCTRAHQLRILIRSFMGSHTITAQRRTGRLADVGLVCKNILTCELQQV
jgi:hypothetical protein